jgi:U3 small nucleolar RNA-associated protein 14
MKASVPVLAAWEIADVLQMEPLVSLWLKRVKEQALTTMMEGGEIPGYKVVAGRGSRTWTDELEVAAKLDTLYRREEFTKTELLSVAAMEKAIGKKKVAEFLEEFIEVKTGAPTIAPEGDKRPVYDRAAEARKDFES